MAVTKRTRYEVLRRDGNACRYCGQCAPEVKLTIDHVTPVALGGTDSPDNLVAACFDCNAGKSSSVPGAELVADVAADSVRFAKLTKAAWDVLLQRTQEETDYINETVEHIDFLVPPDWRESIRRFFRLGVPVEVVCEAARLAGGRSDPWGKMDRFKYLCGIVWNHCRTIGTAVETHLDLDGSWHTEEQIQSQMEHEYDTGRRTGYRVGREAGQKDLDPVFKMLLHKVERSYPAWSFIESDSSGMAVLRG